jgi:hypothetical protein
VIKALEGKVVLVAGVGREIAIRERKYGGV